LGLFGSPESVVQTINELEENIQEGLSVAKKKQRETLLQAKVVGTSCDVCKPEDVKKLVNFAVEELGSIDIWVGNPVHMDVVKHLSVFYPRNHLLTTLPTCSLSFYSVILHCILL
jgi:NAD(P)-dependent dehydrogenase (short-subunit alcohol dehydrogenase family)